MKSKHGWNNTGYCFYVAKCIINLNLMRFYKIYINVMIIIIIEILFKFWFDACNVHCLFILVLLS